MRDAGRGVVPVKAIQGQILTPLPDGTIRWVRRGLLVFGPEGRILHAGESSRRWHAAEQVGGSAKALIMAPLWDAHLHLPQLSIAGRYHEPLLEWLVNRAFREEARHRDRGYARRGTETFFASLRRVGTLGAGVFSAPFPHSARGALAHARREGLPLRCGPPLMDIAPSGLRRSASRWLAGCRSLLDSFSSAAVVPRFALSCSDRLLEGAGQLAQARQAYVFGHIAETEPECAAVARRFPGRSYAEVYDRAGLLGPRTLLAHGVHLEDAELALLKRRRSVLVHCPSSNEALGSGRMPLQRIRASGVRWCLGSDVGAGPELNMLHVMECFLRVHRRRARTTAAEAYYRSSLAGAEALGFGRRYGALLPGRQAEFLLIDEAPPRVRSAESLLRALIERSRALGWKTRFGRLVRRSSPVPARDQDA